MSDNSPNRPLEVSFNKICTNLTCKLRPSSCEVQNGAKEPKTIRQLDVSNTILQTPFWAL